MSENLKAALCLAAIALLVALAQTLDYHDQLQMEAQTNERNKS